MSAMKALASILFSAILSPGAAFAGWSANTVTVSAEEIQTGENAFDGTSVNEDVSGAVLAELMSEAGTNGISAYFTEYCFAAEDGKNSNFAMYLYVYNARGYEFETGDGKNTVNMAVEYDDDCQPIKYANVGLHYCGQSTGVQAGLVWKFRVMDEDNKIFANAMEQNRLKGERRYDITGVQLRREGYAMASDYKVGAIYRFSGYAAGYGKYVDGNTLTVTKETSDTAELDVRHAFYRPEGYNMALYTQDSLASVYFAVPDELIRKYGELYAVHCSYLEAVTDDIFVTGNSDVYNELSAHVGEDLGNLDLRYGFGAGRTQDTLIITYAASYNKKILNNGIFKHVSNREIDNLKYVFPVAGGMDETDSADGYVLQWEVLQEYMLDYSAGKDDLLYGRYARELFSSVADEETDITLSADDTFDLTSISVDWDSFWDGTWGQDTGGEVPVIQPVENVLSAAQAEEEYYIDESCYEDFKDYYDENSDDGTVYVFHFAMDGYYAPEAVNLDNEDALNYEMDTNAYMARETVYLNFDVIDISLKSDAGEVTVLGVVANPIDVIPSVTPPVDTTSDEWTEWLEEFMKMFLSVLGIIGGIVIIALLWGPLTTLLGLLLKLICAPFKVLSERSKTEGIRGNDHEDIETAFVGIFRHGCADFHRVFHLDGVSGMRKRRRKIDYRHYIAVLITAGMLACWLLFPGALGRLTESFRDIANSVAYYFNELFDLGFNVTPTVNEFPAVLPEGPSFLPDNFEEFQANWVRYWQLWATRENVTDYLYFLVSGLFYFSQGLLIFLPLVLLVRMLVKRNARKKNNDHGKESRALRVYKAVSEKVSKIWAWVLSFIGFLKEHPPYVIAWVLLWLFYFNVYTVVIEFAAFYLYFIVSFDVLNIYRQVYKLFLDLQAPLGFIPLWTWLLLGLCLFLQWRKSIGYMVLEHHERKNRGFINEQPIALLTTGVMRSGKDLMDTDMVLSIEILFRNKALELMQKIDMQYPDFPWLRLEKALQRGVRENRIYNLASCKRYIRQRQAFYERYLLYGTDYGKLKYILYGYDVARYGEERDDKLKVTYLFDALENYAKLYFIYVIECSLIYSNLAVREDFRLLDNGNFPLWRFDLFRTLSVRRGDGSYYSHILDMDALRDGKKVIEHSKASLEFGIIYISEIQNERKNDLGLREVKANAEGANQKNDGFESRLKTIGHGATVMGYPFVRFLGNAQRPEDWGARGREVCSIIRIQERSEMRLALPFFSLEELIYSIVLPKFTNYYLDHRYRRGDMTLPMYLMKQAVSKLCRYYTGVYNTFGYMVQKVTVEAGTMDGKAKEKKYYLAAKKVYASRYKTDFLATVYEAKALATGQGITNTTAYQSLMPELKEMKQVNSYYYDELIGGHRADTKRRGGEIGMLEQVKVYKDGIHYIGIPHREARGRFRRPRHEDVVEVVEEAKDEEKAGGENPSAFSDVVPMPEENGDEEAKESMDINIPCPRKATKKEIFEELYDKYRDLKKREKKRKIYEAMKVYFPDKEKAAEYVEANFRRKRRNLILRRLRLTRKVALHRFNYFVTFTYNSELHDEESFRKGLKNCFRNFCFRKGWRYVGVWERSPEKKRLHFHGLFYIPEGTMPGELIEAEDYSFKTHTMQKTVQNTYFNERFGRSDFEELDPMGLRKATGYIMKYMEKTGEKVVYSKGLPQYFVCDVRESDVLLRMGEYGEKLLLFDEFECYSDGKLVGIVSEYVIRLLPGLP